MLNNIARWSAPPGHACPGANRRKAAMARPTLGLISAACLLVTGLAHGGEVYVGKEPPSPAMMAANLPSAGRYLGSMTSEGACKSEFFLKEGAVVQSYVICPIDNGDIRMWVILGDQDGQQRLVLK